jgi:hypothetical protein
MSVLFNGLVGASTGTLDRLHRAQYPPTENTRSRGRPWRSGRQLAKTCYRTATNPSRAMPIYPQHDSVLLLGIFSV